MLTYRAFATATATAEHVCSCECCKLARVVEVTATWSETFEAEGPHAAHARAVAEIGAALDDATPRGYYTDLETEHITVDVTEVSDLEAAGYPRIPGL